MRIRAIDSGMFSLPPALDGLGAFPWLLVDKAGSRPVEEGVAAAGEAATLVGTAPGRGRFWPLAPFWAFEESAFEVACLL
jgi:hypothetical protein